MSENQRHDLAPRVAITGAGGQIGSFILSHLQIRGFAVFPISKVSLLSDITEIKPDLIINCIGRGSDIRRECTEEEIWNSNYYVASEILNFAINNRIRFLNIGSILEKKKEYSSAYIESKRASSALIRAYFDKGHQVTSLLTPIVYGLRIEHVLISDLLRSAITKVPVNLESPNAIREFIHINDLVDLVIKIIELKEFGDSSVEIGNGTGYKLSDLCDSVLSNYVEPTWKYTPVNGRTNDIAITADVNFIETKLKLDQKVELITWLKQLLDKKKVRIL